jgi:chromosome segregation ATPase
MQPQHQFDVDGNRNKLFAGLTKKLVSLEQEVLDKDAQLRAYRSRDSSLSLELHNATVALGQERGLLNLANATISKLESNLQEILPQLEHHLEQNRRVAHLEEQLAQSDASLEILRTKCESLSIFKEEQVNLEVSRTVSDREMLGSLIREVQSERTRAEQTRIRILDQVTSSKCAKKKRFHLLEYFNRWKHDNRFCRKYSELYLRSSQCHGVRLLRNA